jgi:hypothetical protein
MVRRENGVGHPGASEMVDPPARTDQSGGPVFGGARPKARESPGWTPRSPRNRAISGRIGEIWVEGEGASIVA